MNRMILSVIGGGSVNWMRGLMRDVYMMDEVEGGEIRLIDPNTEHVNAVAAMLNKFNELRHKDYKISTYSDFKGALNNSDFVLMTFSPGAMDAFFNDLEIPIKYGIRQPVSMTVGPSGISAALRTVPVAYEIVQEMEKVCPSAWVLNLTNPMSTVTKALSLTAKNVKVIGMCHEFHGGMCKYVGPLLDLPRPDSMNVPHYIYKWLVEQGVEYTVAGLNHFIWLTKLTKNGVDQLPMIRAYCDTHWGYEQDMNDTPAQATNAYGEIGAAKFALCRQFGFLPLPGDRHLVEFYSSLCNPQNGYGMQYSVLKTTVDSRRLDKVLQLDYIHRVADGKQDIEWVNTGEEMIEIMKAILTNDQTDVIANLPNVGQVANLPMGAVVETLGTLDKDGVTPKMSDDLPGSVGSLCRLHVDIHELTVQAALEGSRKKFIEALSLDPMTGSADFTKLPKLADELIYANKKWLPRFW